jgi:hypothetical protein
MELKSEFQFPVASPPEKGPLYSLNWRLVGLQSRTVGFGERNVCCGFVTQFHFKRFLHIPDIKLTYSEITSLFIRNWWHWCGRMELFFYAKSHVCYSLWIVLLIFPSHDSLLWQWINEFSQSFQENTGTFPVLRQTSFLKFFCQFINNHPFYHWQ